MDMQTRVIFKIYRGEAYFEEREALLHGPGECGPSGVEISEQQAAEVTFLSDDPKAYLEIECFDSPEEPKVLEPGDTVVVNSRKLEDTLVPGDYLISATAYGKTWGSLYKVIPSSLSWQGLVNLRDCLESLLTGLSYDMYSRRAGMSVDGVFEGSPSALKIYRKVDSEYENILNNLNMIIKNPITHISGEYREAFHSRRPDARSQRWLARKGMARNYNSMMPEVFFEKQIVTTMETAENFWIKKIIYRMQNILRGLEIGFSSGYGACITRYEAMDRELMDVNKKLEKTSGDWNARKISSFYRDRKRILEGAMAAMGDKVKSIEESKARLSRIIGNISRFQYETWLKDIPLNFRVKKPTLRLMKDKRYSYIYHLYKDLTSLQRKEYSRERVTFPYKKTSLLFEYYILALVIRALEESGYTWTGGWLADEALGDRFSMIGGLESETTLVFEKDDGYVEVVYDAEIREDNVSRDKSGFTSSSIKRPDIRIAAFDREGNLKKAVIVEVKCRKFNNLYKAEYDTDAMKQIKDYLYILYYNARLQKREIAVEKVIVPVPRQDRLREAKSTSLDQVVFIPIEPSKPDEVPGGYEDFKKEIGEALGIEGFFDKPIE